MDSINIFDAARFIIDRFGEITKWKLQKLVYFCQAWSLVWDDKPLFQEKLLAYAAGPFSPELEASFGKSIVLTNFNYKHGDSSKLSEENIKTINAVIIGYGQCDSEKLGRIARSHNPWIEARLEVPDFEKSNNEVTQESIADFYTVLLSSQLSNGEFNGRK